VTWGCRIFFPSLQFFTWVGALIWPHAFTWKFLRSWVAKCGSTIMVGLYFPCPVPSGPPSPSMLTGPIMMILMRRVMMMPLYVVAPPPESLRAREHHRAIIRVARVIAAPWNPKNFLCISFSHMSLPASTCGSINWVSNIPRSTLSSFVGRTSGTSTSRTSSTVCITLASISSGSTLYLTGVVAVLPGPINVPWLSFPPPLCITYFFLSLGVMKGLSMVGI